MQDQFNLASLAKLSNSELQTLLATLTSQFHAASNEFDRTIIRLKIADVRSTLGMK